MGIWFNMVNYVIVIACVIGTVTSQCSEVCFPGLECFDNCPPFDDFPTPNPPNRINTQFQHYNRNIRSRAELITAQNLGSYDGNRGNTVFITHGFTQGGDSRWIIDMKEAVLTREDCSVVVIHWADGAVPDLDRPLELVPAANSRVVARQTRNLVRAMMFSRGLRASNIHCIGFSVGGQLCGFLGKEMNGIGRISGLDPAGSVFDSPDSRIRLDRRDATFVDVIHTNAIGDLSPSGINRAIGHVDFWPNQGRIQPSCEDDLIPDVCSHSIACDYYRESISQCFYSSNPCRSEFEAKNGRCGACSGSSCQYMGYHSNTRSGRGNFQLTTRRNRPHCIDPRQPK